MAGVTGLGFLPIPPGMGPQEAPPSDPIALLQAILQELQTLRKRLAPDEMYRTAQFNNSAQAQTIALYNGESFNSLSWSLTGAAVYVYFDQTNVGGVPDFICTATTQEQFLIDIQGKTVITLVPQGAVTGTVAIQRY